MGVLAPPRSLSLGCLFPTQKAAMKRKPGIALAQVRVVFPFHALSAPWLIIKLIAGEYNKM